MRKGALEKAGSWPALGAALDSGRYLPDFAGAEVVVPSSTECDPWVRAIKIVRLMEVQVNRIADQAVNRVSRLAAPRGPKAVCDPWPPKAPARSALLPCCSRTTPIKKSETMM